MNKHPPSLFIHALNSKHGEIAVVWSPIDGLSMVVRIFLSTEGAGASTLARARFPLLRTGSDRRMAELEDGIQRMFAGLVHQFDISMVDLASCSPFQRSVLMEEATIPRGEVRTYGWLASRMRSPSHARAVGSALARNPFPLVIPCHRTVRSDGSIGGYQGGPSMKRSLLEMEGVRFRPDGLLLRSTL
jgi:methylated-DNA-[protein]-cysteine S-methyltransferase